MMISVGDVELLQERKFPANSFIEIHNLKRNANSNVSFGQMKQVVLIRNIRAV